MYDSEEEEKAFILNLVAEMSDSNYWRHVTPAACEANDDPLIPHIPCFQDINGFQKQKNSNKSTLHMTRRASF